MTSPHTQAGETPPLSPRPAQLAALRAPLAVKIVGANALTLLVLASVGVYHDRSLLMSIALPIGMGLLILHLGLVLVALRPIRDLEMLADRIWRGDRAARFRGTAVADAEVLRVGAMFNQLLDGLTADRARMRLLAEQVVAIGDRERAALARELHDSTAQRMAALLLQLSSLAREARDPELAGRLASLRDAAEALTEDIRLMASSVHPRVLDDLGLVAAIKKLARDTARAGGFEVRVTGPDVVELPPPVAAVLYRVAQEAVRNAALHAGAHQVEIVIERSNKFASIEVLDDGAGFDVNDATRRRPGMGLFTMRERVSLVDGTFEIRSGPRGTIVAATVPLHRVDAAMTQ